MPADCAGLSVLLVQMLGAFESQSRSRIFAIDLIVAIAFDSIS